MKFFRRAPKVEATAKRLGEVLAQAGPHTERIGHHRTQEPNTDPSLSRLAVASGRHDLRVVGGKRRSA